MRGDSLAKSMSHYLIEQIEGLPNVEVRLGSQAVAAEATDACGRCASAAPAAARRSRRSTRASCSSAPAPRTIWLAGEVARDERGFILAGLDAKGDGSLLARDPFPLETSVPGVLVAGDVRARSIKRVASAVGEGLMAVSLIHQYLAEGMSPPPSTAAPHLRPVDEMFDDLDDEGLGEWAAVARWREAEPGEIVVEQGEEARGHAVPGSRTCRRWHGTATGSSPSATRSRRRGSGPSPRSPRARSASAWSRPSRRAGSH